MLKIKRLIILIIPIFLLTSCQQEAQEENVQTCKDMGGNPKITYCSGNSNMICEVECLCISTRI